jgi:dephospho-CoA kinase
MDSQSSAAKPVIGLIGGIGSGKSFVAAELVKHGGAIVSGDDAGHQALLQPDIKARVVERWGPGVLNDVGEVDRKKVGAIVFADPAERKALEALVFPFIGRRLREEIEKNRHDPAVRFVVLDAAIMLEAGWNKVCDRLVYVDSPRAVRLQRLVEQRGWTEKEVECREQAQMPLEEKRRRADVVIDNGRSPAETERQVQELVKSIPLPRP